MNRIVVDGSTIRCEDEVVELMVDQLSLSDYEVRNLHTLYDALAELEEPVKIVLTNDVVLTDEEPEFAEELIDMLEEVSAYNELITFETTEDDGDGYE